MNIVSMVAFPSSSVARKILMALSGLLIFGFLVFHLIGNLFLYSGQAAFNAYVHKLEGMGPLLYVAEAALAALFIYHAVQGIRVTMLNKAARKNTYEVKKRLGKGTLASLTMAVSGVIILVFLVVHIWNFRLQKETYTGLDGHVDLYSLVVETFQNPGYVCFYVVAMLCMGMHILHAFQSSLRTLGLTQVSYLLWAQRVGVALAFFFTIAFSAFPIYFLATGYPKDYQAPTEKLKEQAMTDDVTQKIDQLAEPVTPSTDH